LEHAMVGAEVEITSTRRMLLAELHSEAHALQNAEDHRSNALAATREAESVLEETTRLSAKRSADHERLLADRSALTSELVEERAHADGAVAETARLRSIEIEARTQADALRHELHDCTHECLQSRKQAAQHSAAVQEAHALLEAGTQRYVRLRERCTRLQEEANQETHRHAQAVEEATLRDECWRWRCETLLDHASQALQAEREACGLTEDKLNVSTPKQIKSTTTFNSVPRLELPELSPRPRRCAAGDHAAKPIRKDLMSLAANGSPTSESELDRQAETVWLRWSRMRHQFDAPVMESFSRLDTRLGYSASEPIACIGSVIKVDTGGDAAAGCASRLTAIADST